MEKDEHDYILMTDKNAEIIASKVRNNGSLLAVISDGQSTHIELFLSMVPYKDGPKPNQGISILPADDEIFISAIMLTQSHIFKKGGGPGDPHLNYVKQKIGGHLTNGTYEFIGKILGAFYRTAQPKEVQKKELQKKYREQESNPAPDSSAGTMKEFIKHIEALPDTTSLCVYNERYSTGDTVFDLFIVDKDYQTENIHLGNAWYVNRKQFVKLLKRYPEYGTVFIRGYKHPTNDGIDVLDVRLHGVSFDIRKETK